MANQTAILLVVMVISVVTLVAVTVFGIATYKVVHALTRPDGMRSISDGRPADGRDRR